MRVDERVYVSCRLNGASAPDVRGPMKNTGRGPVDHAAWRRSSHCQNHACVEIAMRVNGVLVRDSELPDGPHLAYSGKNWQSFLSGVKTGRFRGV